MTMNGTITVNDVIDNFDLEPLNKAIIFKKELIQAVLAKDLFDRYFSSRLPCINNNVPLASFFLQLLTIYPSKQASSAVSQSSGSIQQTCQAAQTFSQKSEFIKKSISS